MKCTTEKCLISYLELVSFLDYDPIAGIFTRKNSTQKRLNGTTAGSKNKEGYIMINVCGRTYPAHRLAWMYMYGSFPNVLIDHRDCNPSNNSIDNLRLATESQNRVNSRVRSNNTTGFKGVSKQNGRDKYQAYIYANGSRVHIGMFDTAEEANDAVVKQREILHGEFGRDK